MSDVVAAWTQPEAKQLWQRLVSEPVLARPRATIPSLHQTLGAMLVVGGLRTTPHFLHAHAFLQESAALWGLVTEMAVSCEGVYKCEPVHRGYSQVTRHLRQLSEGAAANIQITLGDIACQFRQWGVPVGRYLAVDGSLLPAWVQQRSSNGDDQREAFLRRRAPEAGFVMHSRNVREINRSTGEITKRTTSVRTVRGYTLTSLVDIATGLTLTFDVRDASAAHEPRVLRNDLLPQLFDIVPTLEVDSIVGDAKYDDDETHGFSETHYGIHLVAARAKSTFQRGGRIFTELDHPTIARIHPDGTAYCRAHNRPLLYVGLDSPSRKTLGLRPGDPIPPQYFRSRFRCDQGCGKPSFPTHRAWSYLPYYPYTPFGRLQLYAQRRALLSYRNQVEASFSSVQVGYKQCLDGAARTRVFDRSVTEALIGFSVVTRALLALHAERVQRGDLPPV